MLKPGGHFFFNVWDRISENEFADTTTKALAVGSADSRANILAGAHYLEQLVSRFGGNLELALAGYNAGPTAVEKLGRAPSLETLRYTMNVEARAASLAAC